MSTSQSGELKMIETIHTAPIAGWRPKDGKIVRVPKTPCDEAYLRKVAYHTLIEWYHLCTWIDDLYEEYHDKPNDAD